MTPNESVLLAAAETVLWKLARNEIDDHRTVPAKIERRFLQRVIEARARNLPGNRANDIVLSVVASDGFKQWEEELPPGYAKLQRVRAGSADADRVLERARAELAAAESEHDAARATLARIEGCGAGDPQEGAK